MAGRQLMDQQSFDHDQGQRKHRPVGKGLLVEVQLWRVSRERKCGWVEEGGQT